MPSGSKIYRYCRTIKFKQQWSTIGPHPKVTLEQARDAAVVLSAQLIQGDDFTAARQAAKDELTLNDLAQLYFDQYAKDRCISFNQMKRIWYLVVRRSVASCVSINSKGHSGPHESNCIKGSLSNRK